MIDWNRVEELRQEVGADAFEEVVAIFLEEVDETMARLSPNANSAEMQDDLHFLKGSALSLGFQCMADLCQTGEAAVREGKAYDLPALQQMYQNSRHVFISGLGQKLSA